jgi:cation transport protein ChaC
MLQQMILQAGLDLQVWSDAELQASLETTLQTHPSIEDLWLFAYGSLIWNPVFHYCDRRLGKLYGWHRQFCLWTPLGRGTPENPGLVLGLERGGCCRGVLYRIAAAHIRLELLLVWRREMVVGSYIPRWVKVMDGTTRINALTFTINPLHPNYAGKLAMAIAAQHIATAGGKLGSCADYLMQTVAGLSSVGLQDQYLLALQAQVLALQKPT